MLRLPVLRLQRREPLARQWQRVLQELERQALQQQERLRDSMQVVAAPTHPLASRSRLSLADLEHQRWLLREPGSGSREQFQQLVGSHLQHWTPGLELSTTESILNAVANGLGLCLLSGLATAAALRDGRVVALDLQPGFQRSLRLVWHKAKYLNPALAQFTDFCQHWRPIHY